jgi:hypothetical protein
MVTPAVESMLREGLDEHRDLFKPTEPRHALVPWLTFRVESTYRRGGTVVELDGGLDLGNAAFAPAGMKTYVPDLLENYFTHSKLETDTQREVQSLESKDVRFVRVDLTSYDLCANFQPDSLGVVAGLQSADAAKLLRTFLAETQIALQPQDRHERGAVMARKAPLEHCGQ